MRFSTLKQDPVHARGIVTAWRPCLADMFHFGISWARGGRRGRGRHALSLLLLLACCQVAISCSFNARRAGLLEKPGTTIRLAATDGKHFRLILGESSRPLRSLEGCQVSVEGCRIGAWLVVKNWKVTDAGDGSEPYIGILRQHGSRLLLEDRNTGMPLLLDQASAAELEPFVGRMILVIGFIVGAQEVGVVAYRVISD